VVSELQLAQGLVVGAYLVVLLLLSAYGVHRSYLVWLLHRTSKGASPRPASGGNSLPTVTVQLPVFNEAGVIERLIDAACALDYPGDRLEIQVLDDSTDETRRIAARCVAEQRRRGVRITHLCRCERVGFKAGALAHGLEHSPSELVAMLDADFVPEPDFLRCMVGSFADPHVGMVQACWTHLNRDRSLLTRVQAQMLDAHFLVEHEARFRAGRFFNFNGTAGIWRRRAIEEAGGWQGDTLTEDLDLSYRAQLEGWRFVFRPDVHAAAELPESIAALKAQQRRWARGSVQTARKLLGRVFAAPVPLATKVEAFFHLSANLAYPMLVLLALLMVPNVVFRQHLGPSWRWLLLLDAAAITCALGSLGIFYVAASLRAGRSARQALWLLPAVMAVGVGISVSNTLAVLQGLLGRVGTFERTPKSGSCGRAWRPLLERYRVKVGWLPIAEGVLGLYTLAAVWLAVDRSSLASIPLLVLFPAGLLGVALGSVLSALPVARAFHASPSGSASPGSGRRPRRSVSSASSSANGPYSMRRTPGTSRQTPVVTKAPKVR